MKGYYFFEQPGRLQPARSEVGAGWYNTGDVVEVDDEGYVRILGRVKRFAKIAGEMVSLELVERIAYDASPGCKHAATVEELVRDRREHRAVHDRPHARSHRLAPGRSTARRTRSCRCPPHHQSAGTAVARQWQDGLRHPERARRTPVLSGGA